MTKSSLRRWLNQLGNCQSIHRRLSKAHIVGLRQSTVACPLAHVLSVMNPRQKVAVYSDCIDVGKMSMTPPKHIAEFIKRFDNGVYPDLVAP